MGYNFTISILISVLIINVYLAVELSTGIISRTVHPKRVYTYIDDDYPDTLQIPHPGLQYVALRVEDSEHYSICAPEVSAPEDLAQIEAEWTSIFPSGKGFIHIGPHGREFTISMFHQLHCINNIRLALGSQPVPLYHVQHCMNYLRQMILCTSNTRLEPMSRRLKEKRNVTGVDGLGLTHVCRDWSVLYQIFEDEHAQWEKYT